MEPVRGYARSGDTNIAYAVLGEGPPELVFVLPLGNPMELGWEMPAMARFWQRLASFARVIVFDQRGTGASDPVPAPPTLDEQVADIEAVVDAVAGPTFALTAGSQSVPQTIAYAARHPDRVEKLMLYGASARLEEAPDYPIGLPRAVLEAFMERYVGAWGTGRSLELIAPTVADDAQMRAWWGRGERTAGTPGMLARLLVAYSAADVREQARQLTVPTLMLHRADDRLVPIAHARWLQEAIPDARLVELEGIDHMAYFGDVHTLLDETEEWLTGQRSHRERILTALLFADVVDSTGRATALGDRSWREVLERHDAAIRTEIRRAGGAVVGHAGDGFLAEFATAGAALAAARAIRAGAAGLGLELRAGIHVTECERIGADVGGLGVHLAARVAAAAAPGEILVSRTVADVLMGSGAALDDRGEHELKGIPGRWPLLAVSD